MPALIHQTEVSWDATLDPASYFKIGQVLLKDQAKLTILYLTLLRLVWVFLFNLMNRGCVKSVYLPANHSMPFLLAFLFQSFCSQIVEAKVHQLDFALERIFLSLKEITVIRICWLLNT